MVESISELEMGLVVKGLICKEDFKQDALWDNESVEVLCDRGAVITGIGVDEEAAEFGMY